jgi:toxin CptA
MFLISLFLAALMGYAIQRGATCTVAAMDEIVRERRAHRLMAMLEASIWVAGSFLLAQALGFAIALPMGHATSVLAILGGLLLGAGAYVNQACVFGAIARLGSGEWAYVFTPLGFLAGAWMIAVWMPAVTHASIISPLTAFPVSLALAAAVFMVVRIVPAIVGVLRAHPSSTTAVRKEIGGRLWRPEAATAVIGVTFFFLLVIEGAWAYTDVLNEAAQGKWQNIAPRAGLLLALLAGATLGGWTAGRLRRVMPGWRSIALCFAGGALMGAGSAIIPGSNDGLILLGMPLLFAHAWIAFLAMAVGIGALMLLRHALSTTGK